MFWKEKTKGGLTGRNTPMMFMPPPPKKEICLMRELLNDIEKYDLRNNIEVRDTLLIALSEQIEIFKTKKNEPNRSI